MHRKIKHPLLAAACAGALASVHAGVARAVTQPLVYVQVLGSTSPSGPFTSALSNLTASSTVYFEVTDVLAPIGTVNGATTITSESPSLDGVNDLEYTLTGSGTSFVSAALATSPTNFTNGSNHATGTLTSGALTNALPSAGTNGSASIYDGAIASGPLDVMETGNLTFSSNGNITGAYSGSGAISVNSGTKHLAAGTSIFNYGNPLLLSNASTLAWSGQASATWTDSNNFNGSTFTNNTGVSATPVSFADSGVTTSNVSVPGGGVTPFSVTFNNATTPYTFTNASGVTGIAGTAPVTLNGASTVSFASPNTYSGYTTVHAGTLRANNGSSGSATGTGNIYVTGGTLGGAGTVTGTVDVNSGSITAGMDATHAGTLATGAETWNSGVSDIVKFNDLSPNGSGTAGTNWDLITMAALNVPASPSSAITIAVQSFGSFTSGVAAAHFQNGTYEIATVTSTNIPNVVANSSTPVVLTGPNGLDTSLFALNTSGFANDVNASSNGDAYLEFLGNGPGTGTAGSLDLVYNASPEPGAAMLILGGVAPLVLARRRRAGKTLAGAKGGN